jgi:hypothetical protein
MVALAAGRDTRPADARRSGDFALLTAACDYDLAMTFSL